MSIKRIINENIHPSHQKLTDVGKKHQYFKVVS